jgi:Na+-driven multidrug efflux pump
MEKQNKHFETNLWKLAIPIILMVVVQVLMTMVDQFMMGLYDEAAVPAVYMGGYYRMFVYLFLMIISMGAAIYMNQYYGAKKFKKANEYSGIHFITTTIVSILIWVLLFFGAETFLKIMQTPQEQFDGAVTYMTITSLTLLFGGLLAGSQTHLQMIGKTKPFLTFTIIGQVINISLN